MAKKSDFQPKITTEREFTRALKKIARVAGGIIEPHIHGHVLENAQQMMDALENYSKLITPWAERQATKILTQVSKSNKKAYKNKSKILGEALNLHISEGNVGAVARALMNEQVGLIKSIPIEAGKRAQELALQAFYQGTRSDEIAKELMRTTEVTESRATLIARTEIARSNATINQARALSLGSNQYVWRNSGDESVRPSHKFYKGKKLDGMIFSWDNPPTLDDGMRGHAGNFPNCRCYSEILFDE